MKKNKNKKIIFWDLEISPALSFTWGIFKANIPHDYVVEPWNILCVGWKELGEDKVHSLSVFDADNMNTSLDYRDDYLLCKKLRDVINSADVIVAHNGDSFDLKMFNSRLIYHGLPPVSPYILTVDTLKEGRKVTRTLSASMDYLCRFFNAGQRKMKTDKYLWLDIVHPSSSAKEREKAMNYMVKYCKQDIKANESLYLKMLPYMKTHPNLASSNTCNCPKCDSDKTVKNGVRKSKSGIARQEHLCNNCGSYFSSRFQASEFGKSLSKL